MSRILIISEHENELFQLSSLLALAKSLKKSGHEISFFVYDIINCHLMMAKEGFDVFQTPIPFRFNENNIAPPSYYHLLKEHQYHIFDFLIYRILAYQKIYQQHMPDLLIFDYSPGAYIASLKFNVARVVIGNGYKIPQLYSSTHYYKYQNNNIQETSKKNEIEVRTTINNVLKEINGPQLTTLNSLFVNDAQILATFPELDHCNRINGDYWGVKPFFKNSVMKKLEWPSKMEMKKIFIYLTTDRSIFNIFKAVQQFDFSTFIYTKIIKSRYRKYNNGCIELSTENENINQRIEEADFVICNADHDIVCSALYNGKPLLLLPEKFEQSITARNVIEIEAGIMTDINSIQDIFTKIELLTGDQKYKKNAQMFALKYKDYSSDYFLDRFCNLIDQLLLSKYRKS